MNGLLPSLVNGDVGSVEIRPFMGISNRGSTCH